MLRRETDEVFDSALREVAERVLPLAYAELLSRETTEAQRVVTVGPKAEQISYVVRDAKGAVLLQSSDADLAKFPNDPPLGFSTTDRVRAFTVSGVKGTIFVTTVEDLAHRRAAVWRSVAALIWPLLALAPTIVAAVWISVRLAFKPVDRFRGELADRGRGNLTPVAASGLPDEITPVAASVNALIGRLRDALEAERGFAANSAHELRTPIAAALAQSQRLHRRTAGRRAAAARGRGRLGVAPADAALGEAPATGQGRRRRVDRDDGEAARPGAPAGRRGCRPRPRSRRPARTCCFPTAKAPLSDLDPDAFAVLARNLIENAVKHGDPEQPIEARLAPDRFCVVNRGPTVPPERLRQLTAPVRARADARGRLGARSRDRLGDLSRRRPDARTRVAAARRRGWLLRDRPFPSASAPRS